MELGFHIADFTWSGGPGRIGADLEQLAKQAEDAGVARLTVMDHLWQFAGDAQEDMLEAYTTLGYLAHATAHIRLHTLVTAVTYRQPGLLAKTVSTLDVLSGGRAGLGIGVGVYEREALGLGLDFAPVAERFERLEETLQICLQMWRGQDGPFRGQHYQLARTLNVPAPLSKPRPYLLVAGSGRRKTLRLVARYADGCNVFGDGDEARRTLEALRTHCQTVGRDYDEIDKTTMICIDPRTTSDQLLRQLRTYHDTGMTAVYIWTRNPEPFAALDTIAGVVAEVSGW